MDATPAPIELAIEAHLRDVDREALRANLALTCEQRFLQLMELQAFAGELQRRGGRSATGAATDYQQALQALVDAAVRFVIVGGAAATAHGSARLTHGLSILYAREPSNRERLARALTRYTPAPRDSAASTPFALTADTLARSPHLSLTSSLGDLDLLSDLPGAGTYADVSSRAVDINLFARRCRCLPLPALIAAARAAAPEGPEELEAIAELEALLEEQLQR
jgi:hypothetical protein